MPVAQILLWIPHREASSSEIGSFEVQSLSLGKNILVITWVDDILIYGRRQEDVDNLIRNLQEDGFVIRKEGTAEGYLGLNVQRDGNKTILTQPGLIKRIIERLGLSRKFSTAVSTAAEQAPLP